MANWNTPDLTTQYPAFLQALKDRDTDVLIMNPGTNLPVGAKRWEPTVGAFQSWSGTAWVNLVISTSGGGTGGTGGLPPVGTMAFQNANAVAITGGTITGVALDAGTILSGVIALNRGGTGASLALGASGSFLQSNGSTVVFGTSGAALTGINAAGLVGVVPGTSIPNPLPAVSGVNLTNLTAANLVGALPALNAINLTNLNAAQLTGTMPAAALPNVAFTWPFVNGAQYINIGTGGLVVGTPNGGFKGNGIINANNMFIDGQQVLFGSGGIPSGLIGMFDGGCPAGWTRFSAMDGRFPWGNATPGLVGGTSVHHHHVGGNTNNPDQPNTSGSGVFIQDFGTNTGSQHLLASPTAVGNGTHSHLHQHLHPLDVQTDDTDVYPPYRSVVFCSKD